MFPTRLLREAQHRVPMIKFLGKRVAPSMQLQFFPYHLLIALTETISPAAPANEPAPHPASPSNSLPDSFMSYRSRVQQHGPLANYMNQPSSAPSAQSASPSPAPSPSSSSHAYGAIGGHSGHELGHLEPANGEVWDRSELPARFGRMAWTDEEIEALELGGAGLKVGWGGA